MHRLEPVARIRQRATRDGGERILQIALFERLPQRNLFDFPVPGRNQLLAHAGSVSPTGRMNKA